MDILVVYYRTVCLCCWCETFEKVARTPLKTSGYELVSTSVPVPTGRIAVLVNTRAEDSETKKEKNQWPMANRR
jgi:hypothetical protein